MPFLQVFFAIWWAWMNFTWFASSFDTDDVPYRLLTMVQMAGVLVLAAGLPAALEHGDFGAVALGYVIMRLGLVAQWLRVAVDDPASRGMALRHAIGITIAQVAWVLWLGLDAIRRCPVLRGARRPRARHPALGGAKAARQLAPASHRRALRPLHDHPPRRERVRRVDRRGPGARRRRRERTARGGRRLRPRARLRALVAVLPPAGRRRPRLTSRSLVPLGLRPLRHLRRARRGRRRARGRGRAHRPSRRRVAGRGRLRHRGPGQRVPRPAVGAARPDRVPARRAGPRRCWAAAWSSCCSRSRRPGSRCPPSSRRSPSPAPRSSRSPSWAIGGVRRSRA